MAMTTAERQAKYRETHAKEKVRLDLYVEKYTARELEAVAKYMDMTKTQAIEYMVHSFFEQAASRKRAKLPKGRL